MRTKILTLILLLPLSLFAFSAKVIKISDGDTITVLNSKEQTKVRLYGIDAPEKKQDYDQKTYCSADIWNEDMYVYYALIKNIPN